MQSCCNLYAPIDYGYVKIVVHIGKAQHDVVKRVDDKAPVHKRLLAGLYYLHNRIDGGVNNSRLRSPAAASVLPI